MRVILLFTMQQEVNMPMLLDCCWLLVPPLQQQTLMERLQANYLNQILKRTEFWNRLDEAFFRWLCILHLLASLESSYLILEQLLVGEPISVYRITRLPSKAYNVCTPKASDIALSYQKVTIRVFLNVTSLSCNVLFGETRGKGMVEDKTGSIYSTWNIISIPTAFILH